jgi:hypothetical protein
MRDHRDAKTMAQSLRKALAAEKVTVTHSQSLELIAQAFGLADWNMLSAAIEADKAQPVEMAKPGKKTLYCSFCGKSQHIVETLIAGPDVMICNECVALCEGVLLNNRIGKSIAEVRAGDPGKDQVAAAADAIRVYSDEHLAAVRKSSADWLEHVTWGLGQIDARLERGAPWSEPPEWKAVKDRAPMRDPLAGMSTTEIADRRAELEKRQREVRERLEIIDRVIAERQPA